MISILVAIVEQMMANKINIARVIYISQLFKYMCISLLFL